MERRVNLTNVVREITSFLPDEIKARYEVLIINNMLFLHQIGTNATFLINYYYTDSKPKKLKFEIIVNNLIISNVEALNDKKILSVKTGNDDQNFNLMFDPKYSIIKLVNEDKHSRIYFEYEIDDKRLKTGIYNFKHRNSKHKEFYPEIEYRFRDDIYQTISSNLEFIITSDYINYSGEIKKDDEVDVACISNNNLLSDTLYNLSLSKIGHKLNSFKYFGYPIVGALIFENEEVSKLLSYICDNIIPARIDNTLMNLLLSRMLSYSYKRNLPYSQQIMTIIKCTVNQPSNIQTNLVTSNQISEIITKQIGLHPALQFDYGMQRDKPKEKRIGVHPEFK